MRFIVLAVAAFALCAADGPAPSPIEVNRLQVMLVDGSPVNCITFTNRSDRAIVAVNFVFSHVDVFGDPQGKLMATRSGTFSPGIAIEGPTPNVITERAKKNCWHQAIESFSLGSTTVAVTNVRFSDGTQWTNGADNPDPAAIAPIDYTALGLPNDMQKVAVSRGRPCHVSSADNSAGSVQVWHYDCASDKAAKGAERYYFLDGRLVGHVVD